ncbi:sensor histidine kinase [Desulfitobacterium chlororespirans]|uniref:histidine kinase n=1 Tax=Desulfitobacterium chlororespirans DSM 11544 TaxID=1121395 RepID=A0A1M7UXF2_9FIRM|nr:sensor histidine kinase KdpD [Desulfitobacterium chlororespirans]SHN87711.1 two-component system, OmpR family, sensor histidine kinase KdpD [Desulfitobacterium chlororespirans DSM 11544]
MAIRRGRLRIYFGYAAGVGKTCAMLNDAHEAKKDGVDVVAGYIEPHARPETMALLEGLEALPFLEIAYKGVRLKEFDLDRAIRRRPELILVDELAHTNAGGCRHKKRYQDVAELLQAGIDVYTTVNVQHIESLNDVVASITGITVGERIPDSVFDSADQIELVDIEPSDLIERLHKGKIYCEEQAQRALANFFTKEKLIALREIALRRTADQVNRVAVQNREPSKTGSPYTNEHILVCLSSAPSNAKVIRTAARMADAFHGALTALFVETPGTQELTDKSKATLSENLRLAEQLGAQIATVYGEDIPAQIAEYAKASRVSKIVMGRSGHIRRWLPKTNFVDRLTILAPTIDIYIIPDTQSSFRLRSPKLLRPSELSPIDSAKSAGILLVCTLIGLWFFSLGFSEANIITVYILGVLLNAILTRGRIYSAVSSILSVLVFNFFFTDPRFSFEAVDPGYPVTFLVMLAAALITGTLTKQVKEQARQSAQKAYRTEVLLETSRKLQQAKDKADILSATAQQMVKLLDRTVIFYPIRQTALAEPLVLLKKDSAVDPQTYLGADEGAVAEWVYKNNKRAGAATNTLSAAQCLYLAVRGGDTVLAVAGIVMDKEAPLEAFEKSLMIAMLGECALALEKERLNETQKQISLQVQQEQLRANLLRAISHDLRTPLTSISGNVGVLLGNSEVLSETQKRALYTNIYGDSIWLINLVENLLALTRIDNGTMNLNMQSELLEEVIAEALLHIRRNSAEHKLETRVADDLLMAKMDSRLIIQVLINMVDNAVKYTPPGSHITISARQERQTVLVEVADDGPGIGDEAKAKLFDMFYTAGDIRGDGRRGLGLGLYLCKAIIDAHGGKIYVQDNLPQGTVFGFTLQAEEVNIHE